MNILNTEQRQYLISLYRQGSHTQAALAKLAGTTQGNVSKILQHARKHGENVPRREPCRQGPRELTTYSASQVGSGRRPLNLDYL